MSDDNTITLTTPACRRARVNDVVVTNTDGKRGHAANGWIADFLDVPGRPAVLLVRHDARPQHDHGRRRRRPLRRRRADAAAADGRLPAEGRHGLCYMPPPCTGAFPDVPCPSTFADWIEALAAEGITGGCGGGNYCPTNPVRRDQMAVFLLKAEHGSGYTPPACAGHLRATSPCPSTFADWIEQLAAENITGGCGGGNYCPLSNNTRGQMAVFITKTFGLQ